MTIPVLEGYIISTCALLLSELYPSKSDRLANNSPTLPITCLTSTTMAPKSIRVGVVGLSSSGWAARGLAPGLINAPSFSLTAVSTTSAASAEASAKKYSELAGHPVKSFHGDASAIANDKDVDLVAVSVKAPAHKEVALAVIKAGKDIFVEWPVGANAKDTNEIVAAAKSKGVKALVGLQGRHSPTIRKVCGHVRRISRHALISLIGQRNLGFGQDWANSLIYHCKYTSALPSHVFDHCA